jgi:NADH-quinone oxidoreductase subunit J
MLESINLTVYTIIAALLFISSFCVFFFNNNPIHSVLFLILSFFLSAIILLMFGVDYIALLFILVYVGAVAVLFLFVIMMINKRIEYAPISDDFQSLMMLIFLVLLVIVIFFVSETFPKTVYLSKMYSEKTLDTILTPDLTSLQLLGIHLYSPRFSVLVYIAGLILLVALIGSISLTISFKDNEKFDNSYKQLARKAASLKFK